jgi:predicted unusual protein kinase regulating ubiquinone biosynthesis (AarF/ABC1/UbiB family)
LQRTKDGVVEVAVKVLHPNLLPAVENDINALHGVAWLIELVPRFRNLDLPNLIDEFKLFITAQVDLRLEARHLERFRENFASNPLVYFPRPFTNQSTSRVLIEDLAPGIPIARVISESSDAIKKHLGQLTCDSTMKMLFVHNLSHGDMHPGNILVTGLDPDNLKAVAGGRGLSHVGITLLDVGITAELGKQDWARTPSRHCVHFALHTWHMW